MDSPPQTIQLSHRKTVLLRLKAFLLNALLLNAFLLKALLLNALLLKGRL
jgi:hypothetical protein